MRFLPLLLLGVLGAAATPATAQSIRSPNGTLALTFSLDADGVPRYALARGAAPVVRPSVLGLLLKDQPSFDRGFVVTRVDSTTVDQTWTPVWGEEDRIRAHYRELAVTLSQPAVGGRTLVIRFRLQDDGLGFRYEFPAQRTLTHFVVRGELTQFTLTGDHRAFYLPGDYDTNEYPWSTGTLRTVRGLRTDPAHDVHARTPVGPHVVQTPLMLTTADGLYINIHEAALVNYPAMQLDVDTARLALQAHLVPDAVGNRAYLRAPARTPWRTVIVADRATDILASRLILNLNEPTALTDTRWIRPTKYVGLWWEMHVGQSTWDYAGTQDAAVAADSTGTLRPSGRHGATTARVKQYIDFAARHGFGGVLVEGWNTGWEDWFGQWKEEVFDFVTPYPDFDVAALSAYARRRGVKLIMHHETSGSATNYERRMDAAYDFMRRWGYDAVKTGYVGRIIPRGEHHDGQWMVNHFNRVAARTASRRIMLDAHEAVRPTGLHRTWPNWLASEAGRGMEFNAWSVGNPPEHETILPFTRLMGGPMDYTPGIFQLTLDHWQPGKRERVRTTLAKQLALYVTIHSPLQMAADLPEVYERHRDALRFISDVAVDWRRTRYLEAEPGDFVTIAREAKDARGAWFVGAITDEQARTATVDLGFLPAGRTYEATIYRDADDAHWERNPMAYRIERRQVDRSTVLRLPLAPGGGAAVSLMPVRARPR